MSTSEDIGKEIVARFEGEAALTPQTKIQQHILATLIAGFIERERQLAYEAGYREGRKAGQQEARYQNRGQDMGQ